LTEEEYEGKYLTIGQAAEIMKCNKQTIRRHIKKGKLPAEKLNGPYGEMYYIREDDLYSSREVVDALPVEKHMDKEEIKELMWEVTQEVTKPLYEEISLLHEEVTSLKNHLDQQKQLTEEYKDRRATPTPWWRKIFKQKEVQ